ncbi:MAG: hypothetical protein M0Q94_12195 [Candidatus Cloacimonetes bacterium]|nr:hypothetical protein [Candidatus Cloacimonadota bacterium]
MKKTSLLPYELEILLGGLLGDSHIRKDNNIIQFGHSDKQIEYLNWKHDKLSRISTEVWKIITKDNYIRYNFQTIQEYKNDMKSIKLLICDKEGNKKLSRKWLNLLSPLSLAIWWMDDGCLSIHKGNRYGKLCTHNFSYEENLIIQNYFKVVWDIKVDIKKEKDKYYFCRFNVENLKKLIFLIYPYVLEIPSMLYKINLNYKNSVDLGYFKEVYDVIINKI